MYFVSYIEMLTYCDFVSKNNSSHRLTVLLVPILEAHTVTTI